MVLDVYARRSEVEKGEIRRNTAEYGEGSALELEWFSEGPMFEGAAGQRGVNVSHVRG